MALSQNKQVTYGNTVIPNATQQAMNNIYENDFRKKGYQPVTMKDTNGTFRTGYVYTDPSTGKGTTYDPYTGNEVGAGTTVYTKSGIPYIKNADGTSSVSNDIDFVDPSYLYDRGTLVNASDANGVPYQGARTLNNITYDSTGHRIVDGSMNYAANGIDYQKAMGWNYGVPYNYRYNPIMDANTVYQQSIPDYMREAGIPDAESLVEAYTNAANRTYQQELDALNYAELENQRTLEDLYRTQAQEQADNLANLKLNGGNAGAQFAQLALQQQANQEGLANQLTSAEEERRKLLDEYVSNVANAQVNAMNQYTTNALAAGQGRAADAYNNATLAVGKYTADAQKLAAEIAAAAQRYASDSTNTNADNDILESMKGYIRSSISDKAYKKLVASGDLDMMAAALTTSFYNDEDARAEFMKRLEKYADLTIKNSPYDVSPEVGEFILTSDILEKIQKQQDQQKQQNNAIIAQALISGFPLVNSNPALASIASGALGSYLTNITNNVNKK